MINETNIPTNKDTQDTLDSIVHRIGKHSEILAEAVENLSEAVNYDINKIGNLLFGAFVVTVCHQDDAAQVKNFKGCRQNLTMQLFMSRVWAKVGNDVVTLNGTGFEYAKEVEKVIDAWDKDNLAAFEKGAVPLGIVL
jgi:hypothetical protein